MSTPYWEGRAQTIQGSVPASGFTDESSAWSQGSQKAQNALREVAALEASLENTGVLGLQSRTAFAATLASVRSRLEERVQAFAIGQDATGIADGARAQLTTAIGNAPGTDAGPGPSALDPQQPDEPVEDFAERQREHNSSVTAHQNQVAALEQAREEHFRRAVLAFETEMYRAADRYAEIDTRPRDEGGSGGATAGAGAPGSTAVPPSRQYELVAITRPDGQGEIDTPPDRPDYDPDDPEPPPPYDPTIPIDIDDGGPADTALTPGTSSPGVSGPGVIGGIGGAAAGVGAGIGLVRAIRGGATLGAAAPASSTSRSSGLARGALGKPGASNVPPAQGRGGSATGRGATGRGAPGSGVGRNGSVGRGSAPVSGSRGTRTIGGSALGRGGTPGGATGRGAGTGTGTGGKGAGGSGKSSGKGSGAVSGSRGTRTIGGTGAGATGSRRGKDDEKDPKKIELYAADDWMDDDEPSGPAVLD